MLRGPYRARPERPPADESTTPLREELVSYVLLSAAGGLPVVGAVAHHEAFHTEATIGLFMLLAGALGLAASVRAAWRARIARRIDRD